MAVRARLPAIVAAALAAAVLALCPAALADPVVISRSADGHAVVELATPAGTLRLALDTGADTSALTHAAISRLGLAVAGSGTAALTALTGETRVDRFTLSGTRIGGLDLPDFSPAAIGHAPDSRSNVDGFLGLDALAGRSWRIDLSANRLQAVALVPCTPGAFALPVLRGEVNGQPVLVIADTGLTGSVGNPALGRQLSRVPGRLGRASVIGAGGEAISARIMRARSVSADGLERRHVDIAIAPLPVFEAMSLAHRPALFAGMDMLDTSVITLTVTGSGACVEISSS